MGSGVGEAITRAAELALERRSRCSSSAPRAARACRRAASRSCRWRRRAQAFARLHEEGVLVVCLLTDPTYGGVSASFATLGDVLIAEPRAYIGFAGPKVIEQTIRQKLPEGFQTAEFLLDHGMLDLVEPRENLQRRRSRKLLELHTLARAAGCPRPRAPIRSPTRRRCRTACRLGRRPAGPQHRAAEHARVRRLRLRRLPGALRRPALPTRTRPSSAASRGSATWPWSSIGHQKGHTTSEMMERNFGMPNPEGYRKGMRLMRARRAVRDAARHLRRHAGRVSGPRRRGARPVDRDRGVIMEMSRLPRPDVTLVTGEGGSGRRARARRRRPGADDGELVLLGDQPGGLLDDPVQGRGAGAARGRGAAPDRRRPAAARDHGRGRPRARGRRPHRSARGGRGNVKTAIVSALRRAASGRPPSSCSRTATTASASSALPASPPFRRSRRTT